ncbi:MAG: 2-C-methyl-D-erythritol 4-phosphate cytidylyltransferase [Coriobacteriia bacterium]|nr:2-C-methyl-D-erythritol 4-phosphate cytidylyltransferase [Coriobacteriia bacterium]MBN2839934.1 2-C-methyl-D-erythritol 4-phosphate cytidylyltransferase [Coriobacteriia bacterium]
MITAIIVAGGTGERLGREGGKQLVRVAGLPVLAHTIRAFEDAARVDAIVVVVHPERVEEYSRAAVAASGAGKVLSVVPGGASRSESVRSGLAAVPGESTVILVHDGARPLVTPEVIDAAVTMLEGDGSLDGVVVGHPSYDTLKFADADGNVSGTADRAAIWIAQTPQVFRAQALRAAYRDAAVHGWDGTDDASFVEHAGGRIAMITGPRDNMKVTVPEDLPAIERLLRMRRGERVVDDVRIGIGHDVHAFTEGRPLVLGGVRIPSDRGLAGHSDADVLVHALMDAILGAMREGDIGKLFPDTDPSYAGISSIELLRRVALLMENVGYELLDADTVLVLEEPKIAPHREAMRLAMAEALGVDVRRVGVKATTTEKLGFTGRGEGVAADAVVLIRCLTPERERQEAVER